MSKGDEIIGNDKAEDFNDDMRLNRRTGWFEKGRMKKMFLINSGLA